MLIIGQLRKASRLIGVKQLLGSVVASLPTVFKNGLWLPMRC